MPLDDSNRDGESAAADVTQLLGRIEQGDLNASAQILPILYDELRRFAAAKMAAEKAGQTLQATALVHEAYMRLVSNPDKSSWDSRRHFFSAAAEAMRRILVEQARRKKAQKRGAEFIRVDLPDGLIRDEVQSQKVLDLEEALCELEQTEPIKAQLVKLRFFAGLTIDQAAQALDISTTTADRYWSYARAWLKREMESEEEVD